MRLSIKSLGIVSALLWGGAVFVCGVANLVSSAYGAEFLRVLSSIYPGFHASRTLADVLIGTGYALVDGGSAGLVFGWLYNWIAKRR
jgi:hypothetical protein